LGLSQALEGEQGAFLKEGDRSTLGLPPNQMTLYSKITALNKPIILILLNGSPILLDWAYMDPNIKAILEAWYPGQSGGTAIANILTGHTSPSGRLPISFPLKMDDIPPIENYNMTGRTYRYSESEPMFPFGYGLSYAEFEYSNLRLSKSEIPVGENISIDVDITNRSEFEAEEVVQLYLKDEEASVIVPKYALQGVQRIKLPSIQTKTVHFEITARQMALINMEGKAIIEPGKFTVYIGGQQPDSKSESLTVKKPLRADFQVNGKPLEVKY